MARTYTRKSSTSSSGIRTTTTYNHQTGKTSTSYSMKGKGSSTRKTWSYGKNGTRSTLTRTNGGGSYTILDEVRPKAHKPPTFKNQRPRKSTKAKNQGTEALSGIGIIAFLIVLALFALFTK